MHRDAREIIDAYVAGWLAGDAAAILATVAPECEVVESHGSRYRGLAAVGKWIEEWHAAGGHVLSWEVTSFDSFPSGACFEWNFRCLWQAVEHNIRGCTIARFRDGKIALLREYRMTGRAQLFQ